VLRRSKAEVGVSDLVGEHEPLTQIEEADRFSAALADHQERELLEARAQLEEALKLEAQIPAIRADAAAGRITRRAGGGEDPHDRAALDWGTGGPEFESRRPDEKPRNRAFYRSGKPARASGTLRI
jgi:hypothetical protein